MASSFRSTPNPGVSGTGMKPFWMMGFLRSRDQIVPPGHVDGMILQDEEILRGGGAVDVGHAGDGRSGEVHGHGRAAFLGVVADALGFENAAGSGKVRVDHIHGRGVDKFAMKSSFR